MPHTHPTTGKPILEAAQEIRDAIYQAYEPETLFAALAKMEDAERIYGKDWEWYAGKIMQQWTRRYKLVTDDPPCLRTVVVNRPLHPLNV